MMNFWVYVDGQFFHAFDTLAAAESIAYWMKEGQTMCVVEGAP